MAPGMRECQQFLDHGSRQDTRTGSGFEHADMSARNACDESARHEGGNGRRCHELAQFALLFA